MAQDIVDGLLQGGMFALVALGLSLVFGVLRLVNLAHGSLLIAGGYLAYEFQRTIGLDPLLSLFLVMPLMFAIAYPIQRFLLTGLMQRSGDTPLVATFSLALIIEGALQQAFSANAVALQARYASSGVDVAGLHMQTVLVIAFGLAVALVALLHLVLTRTRLGIMVRAASSDPATAATMGLNVGRLYAATFAVAAALAAIGGVMIGLATSLTPTEDLGWLVKGFAVVVLGGIGSVRGMLGAALALGVIQAVGVREFGSGYSDVIIYGAFFVILALRPYGLGGRRLAL